jgi:serine phosphatase RsbU (regulator of sigma subunit)
MALGVIKTETWEQATVQLGPGDLLVLYSDGVTDAENEQGQRFGHDRLEASVQTHLGRAPGEIQQALLDAIERFVGKAIQSDDVTLVVVGRDSQRQ